MQAVVWLLSCLLATLLLPGANGEIGLFYIMHCNIITYMLCNFDISYVARFSFTQWLPSWKHQKELM